ncbi:MAG: hypothetical protein R3Y58_05340 [Eubacteriales bacterium]
MNTKLKKLISAIGFLVLVILMLSGLSFICTPTSKTQQQTLLYENEPEDTIDIAFVGSSATYRFYDVMTIWEEYNITSMCYFIDSMPYDFVEPMIEYIEEQQSPEIYVIDLRHIITDEYKMQYYGSIKTDSQKEAFVNALNLLPNSWVKWELITESDYTQDAVYMYWFDVLYNHEEFVEGVYGLIQNGFSLEALPYKGNYLSYTINDIADTYVDFDTVEEHLDYELTESTITRLVELFEFCDENEINAYFTITPYTHSKCFVDQDIRREFEELVTEYGYPFKDYKNEMDEIGLDFTTDFYDKTHANAWGAKKYTLYAMEDILDVYEVDNTYDQDTIDSWDEAYAEWFIYDEEMRGASDSDD